MNWLLWREYRRNRWILLMSVAGILLPYLVAAAVISATDPEAYAMYFVAYMHSYLWAWLAIAVMVGSAVAGGRADRSAEFVAYLPLPRWRVLFSKLILPLVTFAIALGVNVYFVDALIQPVEPIELTDLVDLRVFASVLLVTYSAGWLVTQFLSSALYASIIGLIAPLLVGGLVAGVLWSSGSELVALNGWVSAINLPFALACFGLGTWIFLRRREP